MSCTKAEAELSNFLPIELSGWQRDSDGYLKQQSAHGA